MNEIQLERMQADEGYGRFLLETIAKSIGIEPDAKRIDRAIYKGTTCGAWVRFDEHGIIVGTIVEGSDAEYSERIDLTGINTDDEGETLLTARFWEGITRCEEFADEHFGQDDDY